MVHYIRRILTNLGVYISHPLAFIFVAAFVAAWLVSDRQSFDWHGVAAIATLLMTLFIQRAEHRDTQAIHAKLDELLRVEGRVRDQLTQLDNEEPEVIEEHRAEERRRTARP